MICIIAVLVEYGKGILNSFRNQWVKGILIFFGWGIIWYYACELIEKISGFSYETTFFFTFMPSFAVLGYFIGKSAGSSKQHKKDND